MPRTSLLMLPLLNLHPQHMLHLRPMGILDNKLFISSGVPSTRPKRMLAAVEICIVERRAIGRRSFMFRVEKPSKMKKI